MDGKRLIDQWHNAGVNEYRTAMYLEANQQYPIRLEVQGGSQVALSWSSPTRSKQVIAPDYLYPATEADHSAGVDLLEGLPHQGLLENGLYGWQRSPAAEELTARNQNYWSARTSIKTYDPFRSPDLHVEFSKNTATHSVTRDLGTNQVQDWWRLTGRINLEGTAFNTDEGPNRNGGSFIEVLDANQRVLTQFSTQINYRQTGFPVKVFANRQLIVQSGPGTRIDSVVQRSQPFAVEMNGGVVTVRYGPYAPVQTQLHDSAGDWRRPKTLRLYFWSNGFNQTRIIDLEQMHFATDATQPASATITLSADDALNTLQAQAEPRTAPILVSENGGPYVPYVGQISVGNVDRAAGYWQFKPQTADAGSAVVSSPAFAADESAPSLSVFPNPGQDVLSVQHPLASDESTLRLFTTDGKELARVRPAPGTTSTQLDIGFLAKGSYVLQFQDGSAKKATRFIKQP